ncbi:hypothetical protein LMG29542_01997 [Paraburkholderia humisilvae]|uniref:Uncharacterized protein n=1 Tax=Paraburkholderia humisilvae TaxID=627669 RepID=A0A6J5DIP1_9BURK|nr:hypothetical protein LMG29542_01997 [Paraburkholderia humisilvae]
MRLLTLRYNSFFGVLPSPISPIPLPFLELPE